MNKREQLGDPLDLVDDHTTRLRSASYQLFWPLGPGGKSTCLLGVEKVDVEGIGKRLMYEGGFPRFPGAEEEEARYWWLKKARC